MTPGEHGGVPGAELAALATEVVRLAALEIRSLGATARQAELREPGRKVEDPLILRADRVAERILVQKLEEQEVNCIVLSEEMGRVDYGNGRPDWYVVCDPFDGSTLFRRGIRSAWYIAIGILNASRQPVFTVILDYINQLQFSAGPGESYAAKLRPSDFTPQGPATRLQASAQPLDERWALAFYGMKPGHLRRAMSTLGPLLDRAEFILPNGGPAGFVHVAENSVDAYVALREPLTEVFTGFDIAVQAGAMVTDLAGNPPVFHDSVDHEYTLLCSRNAQVHETLLPEIAKRYRE